MKRKNAASKSQFTIKRSGQFRVSTFGPNHCGTLASLELKYTLEVTCDVSNLDERGFLFDQTRIDEFFKRQSHTELSCEQYALKLSRDLFKQIRAENPKCDPNKLRLTLSPAPFAAELTFEWEKES